MAAKVRDSNMMELGGIINTDNIRPDKMAAVDELDASIVPPSEYDLFKDILHGDDSEGSEESEETGESDYASKSDTSVVTKGGDKKKSRSYEEEYEEEEEEEEEEYEDETGMSSSSDISEHIKLKDVSGVVNLNVENKKKDAKNDKDKKAHSEMLTEIETMRGVLKKRGIPIPNYRPKDIKRHKSYAKEILDSMKHLDNDNKTADTLIHLLRFVLTVLCKTFDGKHEIFNYKIDLRGYKTLVMSDIKDMREETVDFASYVRRKIGISTTKAFMIFRIFILNAGLTIIKNNADGNGTVDMFDEDNDDEYSDDDDSEEDEEAEDED